MGYRGFCDVHIQDLCSATLTRWHQGFVDAELQMMIPTATTQRIATTAVRATRLRLFLESVAAEPLKECVSR